MHAGGMISILVVYDVSDNRDQPKKKDWNVIDGRRATPAGCLMLTSTTTTGDCTYTTTTFSIVINATSFTRQSPKNAR